jgi:hypothetical protein
MRELGQTFHENRRPSFSSVGCASQYSAMAPLHNTHRDSGGEIGQQPQHPRFPTHTQSPSSWLV